VTIPLAQAGFEVVGIDTAEPMLAVARSKLANASANVNFMVGDMRSFNLRARFQLIFVPNNSLGHLLTLEDLRAMLSCVRSHLRRDGVFVIDYFNPSLELLTRSETETHPVTSFRNSAGELVNVTERVRYEAAAQVNHITWLLTQQGEPEQRLSFTLRVYFPMELDAALTLCGFKILAKYGSFAKEPFCSSSKQQVIVCADAA
jgi:SAM-dependent methyltransferase